MKITPVEFIIKEGDENLTSHSGLALIGALLNRTELSKRADSTVLPGCQEPRIPHGDILKTMIGLMSMAKPDYDAIEEFREIPFFRQSLGIGRCPASPALRQRLDVAGGAFDQIIKEESAKMIRNTASEIGTVSTSNGERVPLDIDVSPSDNSKTKKEGVSRTYKGNDALDNIAVCIKEGVDWLIKRNLRKVLLFPSWRWMPTGRLSMMMLFVPFCFTMTTAQASNFIRR